MTSGRAPHRRAARARIGPAMPWRAHRVPARGGGSGSGPLPGSRPSGTGAGNHRPDAKGRRPQAVATRREDDRAGPAFRLPRLAIPALHRRCARPREGPTMARAAAHAAHGGAGGHLAGSGAGGRAPWCKAGTASGSWGWRWA
jgi:hypothetical protein